jgi:two-component system, NarL family, invasion response regulator UvrY
MSKPLITIAIADDHALFRKGLIALIRSLGDEYAVLFEAGSGNEFIQKLQELQTEPHIAVIDINMPGKNGFETVAWLNEHRPQIKVLVVSMLDKEEIMVRMLRMGIKGYLSKDVEPEVLKQAIDSIMYKGFYYTDFITGRLLHDLQKESSSKSTQPVLTDRETEILQWMCTELSYKEIAAKVNLSVKTIDIYKDTLCKKTGSISRIGLVMYAIKNKIIQVES